MATEKLFDGTFKTVKNGEGKDATYTILLITSTGEGDKKKDVETKIGENKKLIDAKKDVVAYAFEKDPKATHVKVIHHKPGREKDAVEKLNAKKAEVKTA